MPVIYYPAILLPADAAGLHGVTVPGVNVNASGATVAEALADAMAILRDVLDDLAAAGQPLPAPAPVEEVAREGAFLVLLPFARPERSVRVSVTLPADLVARIDAATSNRSAFLARWALHGLRAEAG